MNTGNGRLHLRVWLFHCPFLIEKTSLLWTMNIDKNRHTYARTYVEHIDTKTHVRRMCIHTNKNIFFLQTYTTRKTHVEMHWYGHMTYVDCQALRCQCKIIDCVSSNSMHNHWISRCSDVRGRNKPALQLKSSKQMIPAPRSHLYDIIMTWTSALFSPLLQTCSKTKTLSLPWTFSWLFSWTWHFPNLLFFSLFHPLTTGFRRHRCVR